MVGPYCLLATEGTLVPQELAARKRMDKTMLCVFHDINPRVTRLLPRIQSS